MRIGFFTPTLRGEVSRRHTHTLMTDTAWARDNEHLFCDICEYVAPGNSIETQRNLAVMRAANLGCTHLYQLDSDVFADWGRSILEELIAVALLPFTVVGAVVPVNGGRVGKVNVDPFTEKAQYGCQYVSAAAMLIDLRQLMRLGKPKGPPWFKRHMNDAWTLAEMDEGYHFCQLVQQLGGTVGATSMLQIHHQRAGLNSLYS